MADSPVRIRIFVSSPGDVAEERVLAARVIRRLGDELASRAWVEPVFWEHEPLLATETFQSQIPRPSECEVMVCILWSRLGTRLPSKIARPDGSTYSSGTEYEFENAVEGYRAGGQPAMLVYRKTTRPLADLGDEAALLQKLDQKKRLDAFLAKWFHDTADGSLKAAFHLFDTSAAFEELLENHLRRLIARLLPENLEAEVVAGLLPAHAGASAKPVWTSGSPFRGLEFFDIEHAPVFFGRSRAAGEVLSALRKQAADGRAFVLVLGASGSGKSSLVRAGVVPMLIQPGVVEGVAAWRRTVFRAGDVAAHGDGDAFDALAAALLRPEALPELGADGTTEPELARMLRDQPGGAGMLVKGTLAQARLVLVADQLEEIFTLDRVTPAGRAALVAALGALARSGRVWVIATLRSDFYARCAELPELVALKDGAGQFDLLPPTPAEIGQMIRRPAEAAGLRFEVDAQTGQPLDDLLCDAAVASPEALPLLEFALEELYARRRQPGGVLLHSAYRELGGVEGALALRAEQTYAVLPPDVQAALPRVLRALVTLGAGSEGDDSVVARRKAPRADVTRTPQEAALVEAFVAARLFTADRTQAAVGDHRASGESSSPSSSPSSLPSSSPSSAASTSRASAPAVVSVAHEALLRRWPRLVTWLAQDRELLRVRQRIAGAAARWSAEGRSPDLLLPGGKPLAEAQGLLDAMEQDLSANERAFVAASSARAAARVRLRRMAVAALAVLAIVAAGAAIYANRQRGSAVRNEAAATASAKRADDAARVAEARRRDADASATQARRRLAATYATEGLKRIDAGDVSSGLLWLVRSIEAGPDDPADQLHARIRFAAALAQAPRLLDIAPSETAAWTPPTADGRGVIRDGADAYVVNTVTGQRLTPAMHHEQLLESVQFSPERRRVVTISIDGSAHLWDAGAGQRITPPLHHLGRVHFVAFNPAGDRVVTTSADGTAQVWDAATGTGAAVGPPMRPGGDVGPATFSPDGRRVACASESKLRVWDSMTGEPVSPVMEGDGYVMSVAFSPDGQRLAMSCYNKMARIWEAATGKPLTPPMPHEGIVRSATFSPDGVAVLTASDDGTARVWSAATGAPRTPPMPHGAMISHAAFSPDGRRVVTVGDDRAARVWDAERGYPLTPPLRHESAVDRAVFSPDAQTVATVGSLQSDHVWEAAAGQPRRGAVLRHASDVREARFSPDGRRIVTGSEDKTARIWDTATGQPLGAPMRHDTLAGGIVFSPDGGQHVLTRGVGTARVWNAITGEPLAPPLAYAPTLWLAVASPDARGVVAAIDATARVWDAMTGQPLSPPIALEDKVYSLLFSPDGKQVAFVCFNRKAYLYDALTGQPLRPPLPFPATVVAFDRAGRRIVAGAEQGQVQVFDAATGQPIASGFRHERAIRTITFSPDGGCLLVTSDDGTVRVWDAATSQPISPPMRQESGSSSSAQFSPDGRFVVSSSGSAARVWDATTGQPLTPPLLHADVIHSAEFSPDGRQVLTASRDGTARLWDVTPDDRPAADLRALAELLAAQRLDAADGIYQLTPDEWRQRWNDLRQRYPEEFRPRPRRS